MFQGLSQKILAGNVGSDLRRFPESVYTYFLGKPEVACGTATHCERFGILTIDWTGFWRSNRTSTLCAATS